MKLPFKTNSDIRPLRYRLGYKYSPALTRSMGQFRPNLRDIPCGSVVAMQMMSWGWAENYKTSYCGLALIAKFMSKCGKEIFSAGRQGLHKNYKLKRPLMTGNGFSAFKGWDKNELGQNPVYPVGEVDTWSMYCQLARKQRYMKVNGISNKLELVWWFKPADPTAPCPPPNDK